MFNSTFKIAYFILFLIATFVRKLFTSKNRKMNFVVEKKSTGDIILLIFDGIGMITPLIYVFSSCLDFANFNLPAWVGWLGIVLFIDAIIILYLSHANLGSNWSPVLGIKEKHTLITSGIYRYIRHPMYAAHLLWAVAQIMILHNWIAGFSFIVVMIPHYLLRVEKEESMMIEQFGNEYKDYMETSGRILPKF